MSNEAVAVAMEIDVARQHLKDEVAKLREIERAHVVAEARFRVEAARVTDGLSKGKEYVIDIGTPDEECVGGKMAAANIKRVTDGVIAKWFAKAGMAKAEVTVQKAMIEAAKEDLGALRSKNKYLSHT